ncbi:pentatricopeptide repeat-containing protein At2g38420, mitochondrial [Humulus lupulus]|uniref:pentatricopeptide repeat-containing protein At2g38420, mitochondrial n=1 Tax=Humulus lupulus TaxID=3486 RepID=UPI002B40AC27|nr:pentatricopeptide repeat-containing protein At2g38420, mitochondrial [Humulus lupulus]
MAATRQLALTNKFIRKHRKWPIPPYKTKWHQTFNQSQALQALKQSIQMQNNNPHETSPNHLLSVLIHSFNSYHCHPTPEAYHFLIKTLIQTSRRVDHIPPILDRIELVEKFETPEYIFVELIRFYGCSGRFEEAIDVFCKIPSFRCVPSAFSLNSLLSVLCRRSESLRLVPWVLMKSRVLNIRLEESSFRILITALCRFGKVGYAVEILNCMIGDGCDVVDMKICSLVLSSMCEQKKGFGSGDFGVLGFLGTMRKVGFCPGLMDYAKVIKVLVKERKGLDALEVLGQIKAARMKPDIVCYTMVLNGIIKEGEYEKADELFDELLVLGLVPDVYTYNVYINGLCKQNNVEGALDMLLRMEKLGCKPNLISYNLILKALCKSEKLDQAKELLTEMSLNGVGADLQTHRIMLDGLFGKGEIDEACVLMEEMLDKCLCLCCSTYDEIISGLCQRGLECKALELVEKMVGNNVAPGARAWEAMVLASSSELSLPEAIWTGLVKTQGGTVNII